MIDIRFVPMAEGGVVRRTIRKQQLRHQQSDGCDDCAMFWIRA
jgi:hypothetical protein